MTTGDELMLRVLFQEREQRRVQWRVYRWVGVCAFLTIACIVLLSLVF